MGIDKEKISKRISEIQIAISHLKKYEKIELNEFLSDDDKMAAAKYYLLTIIESCVSICTHIATKEIHKVPDGYSSCFKLLAEHKLIDSKLAVNLGKMVGFRNLLIHQYWDIDDRKIHQFMVSGIGDVHEFIKIVGNKYLE